MSYFSEDEKINLLLHARAVITSSLNNDISSKSLEFVTSKLKEKRGCFVTLHKKGELRGCIGTIEPFKPLVECIEENAFNAAFQDPRFSPLSKNELEEIDIEVSVLTVPKKLEFSGGEDLKQKLIPKKHGVILSYGFHRATFLPQVWEQLPACDDFLGHLCLKAGLERNAWKNMNISVEVYEAEYFSEK